MPGTPSVARPNSHRDANGRADDTSASTRRGAVPFPMSGISSSSFANPNKRALKWPRRVPHRTIELCSFRSRCARFVRRHVSGASGAPSPHSASLLAVREGSRSLGNFGSNFGSFDVPFRRRFRHGPVSLSRGSFPALRGLTGPERIIRRLRPSAAYHAETQAKPRALRAIRLHAFASSRRSARGNGSVPLCATGV